MKIAVVGGSPKGKYSITLHTLLYLEKKFPEHEFSYIHAGASIKALEKDFSKAKALLEDAKLIIFAYPVYTFIAPSQLHRFIELMKVYQVNVKGKFATQVTTSKHFYDITAHKYIEENCSDMGLRFIRGLSADMEDLTTEKGQQDAVKFMDYILWCVENGICEPAPLEKEKAPLWDFHIPDAVEKTSGKDVVIVTDVSENEPELQKMIDAFAAVSEFNTRVVNIREYPFKGGCLGCFRCAVSGKCVYTDGFDDFLRNNIQKADAIVYAFTIKDHSDGFFFKQYNDRQFCNGHRAVTMGMPMGYLVNGHYSHEENLKTILEGRAEVGGNFLAGIATNEKEPLEQIKALSKSIAYGLEHKYVRPQNFLGVGGMKIFRDLIYVMRGMMKADHKFYKAHGAYDDMPQKKLGTILKMYAVGALLANPKILAKAGNAMNEGMVAPYKKVVERTK